MKKLGKDHVELRDKIVQKLNEQAIDIEKAIDEVNVLISEKVNPRIEEYNEILANFTAMKDEIITEMESYSDDKSDKWREGETGSAFLEWREAWEALEYSDIDLIDTIENVDLDQGAEIGDAPVEPG